MSDGILVTPLVLATLVVSVWAESLAAHVDKYSIPSITTFSQRRTAYTSVIP